MRRRSRRAGFAIATLGVVLLLTPVGVWAQSAPTDVGFFNLSAEAAGMAITFGDPSEQPYPVAGGTVPQTMTTLGTGPSAYALASAAWPGPLLANAGSLAGILLPACAPAGGVCTPKPDSQTTALGNYPVRAEAQSPGGRGEDTVGPMTARAEDVTADSKAAVADFDATGLVTSGRASTHSRSFIEGGRAVSLGESTVTGIELAGGRVTMSSVRSVARISSDGRSATIQRTMTVQGLEIEGHPATIDERGVHIEGQGGDPGSEVTGPVNENVLAPFGIEMFLTRPREERRNGGEAAVHTGSLVVLWKLGDSGQEVLVSLGGAGAFVQASPGFAELLDGGVDVPAVPSFGGPSGTIGGEALNGAGAGGDGGSAEFTPQVPDQPALAAPDFRPAGERFRGIAPGWVIVGVLGGIMIGFGLRRVQTAGFVPAGACEHQERT